MQYFGDTTRLDPPVTVDGLTCSLALRINRQPTNHATRPLVVSGIVHSVVDLGSGRKRIVCRRGIQRSSYSHTYGPGDVVEIEYDCVSGGNVAYTIEPERILCHANDMAYRGDDIRDRAVPGDALQIAVGDSVRLYLVTSADAFSVAPSSVNWVSETPAPIVTFPDTSGLTTLSGRDEGGEFFVDEDDVLYLGTGLQWLGPSDTNGFSTRRIFDDDPDLYPADASFAPGEPEYWIDPHTYSVRLSSSHDEVEAHTVQLRWFVRGLPVVTAEWWQSIVIDNPSGTPSWGTEDAFIGAIVGTFSESFDSGSTLETSILIVKGAGSLVWRRDLDPGAVGCRIDWDDAGEFTFLGHREVASEAWIDASLTPFSLTFPFRLRVVKSGNAFEFFTSDVGLSPWTSRGSLEITDLPDKADGVIGVVGSAINIAGFSGEVLLGQVQITGRMSIFRVESATFTSSVSVTRASSNAITEVRNLTSDTVLSTDLVSADARDVYRVSADQLVFPIEMAGDILRVIYAPDATVPAGPGRPPRTFDQLNFATMSGTDGIATTNVAENVGNWHDALIVEDPHGELDDLPAGTAFEVYRDPAFDPRNPPIVQWDRRADGDHDWETISTADYRARWTEGLILISQAWVDEHYTGKALCFRVAGSRFVQRSGWSADVHNEVKHSVEVMDQVWSSPGSIGGETQGISGFTTAMTVGATGYTCCGDYENWWQATGVAWGTSKFDFKSIAEAKAAYPYWDLNSGVPYVEDAAHRTTASNASDTTVVCESSPEQDSDLKDYRSAISQHIAGEHRIILLPFEKLSGAPYKTHWARENREITGYVGDIPIISDEAAPDFTNYFGSGPDVGGSWAVSAIAARFGFSGIPINMAEALKRLPDGATIVEARARIKFDGYRRVQWSGSYGFGPINRKVVSPTIPWMNWTYREQGHTIVDYSESGGVVLTDDYDPLFPEPLRQGSVGFRLVAQRKNTRSIVLYDGSTWQAPASTIHSLGAGITAAEAQDGKWKLLDVTNVIQAIVDARDSDLTGFQLWPSNNSLDPDDGVGALASYLRSLMPTYSASLNTDSCLWGWTSSASGAFNWYSSLSVGSIYMRYRLPSGITSEWVLPIHQPPMIPFA